ncbi:MAG: hypothetical protein NTZ05_13485 [Chloroflexi bacterium]|nr:hypothetical protein [Chloroflexota bacterium]
MPREELTAEETAAAAAETERLAGEVTQKLADAVTKDDVVAIWKEYYLKLGHRRLGRLLVGGKKA